MRMITPPFSRRGYRLEQSAFRVDADHGSILLTSRECKTVGERHRALTKRELGPRWDDDVDLRYLDLDARDGHAERSGDAAQIGFQLFLEMLAQSDVVAQEVGGEMSRERCRLLHL